MESVEEQKPSELQLFITRRENEIQKLRLRMVKDFQTMSLAQMQNLIDLVKSKKNLIQLAKIGKLSNLKF